ncbi:hypothetical protein BGW36DRAFT_451780 [Talaromyces proteolyticus]|uniref:Zn(2)-C6 fungal-type domain-containing protein n=1 Tax=Talaromyces proteolyticus TaxID=1131652 RepID=A0AAD4KUQ0_9EURO|nr:uncharacterized protein BGW36DRAFT_451780 [Talaromyces proteolyticus]KAH8696404.1 hypothetical protein BGW36DRAFT_451780 [Talaromyces proteolyticus]
MGKVAWRSNTCVTCRKRKVKSLIRLKCDQEHPVCKKCKDSGLKCEGYYGQGTRAYLLPTSSSTEVPTEDPHTQTQPRNRTRIPRASTSPSLSIQRPTENKTYGIVNLFLDNYIPSNSLERSCGDQHTIATWYINFPSYIGLHPLLDDAISAHCLLFLGRIYEDQEYFNERSWELAYNLYHQNGPICLPRDRDTVIAIHMVMASYEFYDSSKESSTGLESMMVQVEFGGDVLRRFPPTTSHPINRQVYLRVRCYSLYVACLRRKPSFLNDKRWKEGWQTGDIIDEIFDIAFEIPTILEICGQVASALNKASAETQGAFRGDAFRLLRTLIAELVNLFNNTHTSLTNWYARLQNSEHRPLFSVDDMPASRTARNPFSGNLLFSSAKIFEAHLHYWFSGLTLYTIMARLIYRISIFTSSSATIYTRVNYLDDKDYYNAETKIHELLSLEPFVNEVAASLAQRACQAVTFCLSPDQGSVGRHLMVPVLWMVQDYSNFRGQEDLNDWCVQMFGELAMKGCGIASSARSVSYRDFVQMTEKEAGLGF